MSKTKLSRRTFLATIGAGGAAAVAAVAVRQSAQAPAAGESAKDRAGGGYQLTEHVRTYYRTTRV
jgi:hypothetical protein